MKKFFTILGILLLIGAVVLSVLYVKYNESEPEGSNGMEADIMARQMLREINIDAWNELRYVQWTFADRHDFLWDKHQNTVLVKWDDIEVDLDIATKNGKVKKNGESVSGSVAKELVDDAWSYFCNDSFWLNAPAKIMDKGTTRSLVKLEDGKFGLKVTYGQGGVTPGDTYVWLIDEEGMPYAYKMWVKIIPVGGMQFSWEGWETLPGGAKVSTLHKSSIPDLVISNLKGGMTLDELN